MSVLLFIAVPLFPLKCFEHHGVAQPSFNSSDCTPKRKRSGKDFWGSRKLERLTGNFCLKKQSSKETLSRNRPGDPVQGTFRAPERSQRCAGRAQERLAGSDQPQGEGFLAPGYLYLLTTGGLLRVMLVFRRLAIVACHDEQ